MDGETRQLKTCDLMTRALKLTVQKRRRKFPVVLACRRLGGIKVALSVAECTQSPHCRRLGVKKKKNEGVEFRLDKPVQHQMLIGVSRERFPLHAFRLVSRPPCDVTQTLW